MDIAWPIFGVVLFLGVLQLAVGVVVGRALPLRRTERASVAAETTASDDTYGTVRRLQDWAAGLAAEVSEHHGRILRAHESLAQAALPAAATEDLHRALEDVLAGNEELRTRMTAAEIELAEHRVKIEAHLVEARRDSLTRLPNRRAFDDELHARLTGWQRHGSRFALAMFDVDHFKKLNDRYGHLAGDHVLRKLGETLQNWAVDRWFVARIGGEEFAAVLSAVELAEAQAAIEEIRCEVAALEFHFDQHRLSTSLSLGLTLVQAGDDAASITRRADQALYAAKHGGRDCSYFHNGQECVPIVAGPAPGAAADPPAAAERDAAELLELCDDLRQRLAEVAAR